MIEGDCLRTSAVEAGPLRTVSAVKNENEGQSAQRCATLRHAVARLAAEHLRTRRTYVGHAEPRCRAPRGFEIFHGRAERDSEAKSLIKNRLRLASTARRKAIVTFPRPYSASRRQIKRK